MGYGWWTAGVRFSEGAMNSSLLLFVQTGSGVHPASYPIIQWVPGVLSPEVKGSVREYYYSLPSGAEVKNGECISPLPHDSSWLVAYIIKHRYSFTYFYCYIIHMIHERKDCSPVRELLHNLLSFNVLIHNSSSLR
jgi:hypothetical protein